MSYMTAIREYGLTEESGRGQSRLIWVTDVGSALIRPNPPSILLKRAALNPGPFRDLWEQFKTGKNASLPAVQRLLRAEREKRDLLPFTEQGAEEAFKIYRANIQFVGLRDEDTPFSIDHPKEGYTRGAADRGYVGEGGNESDTGIADQEIRVPLNSGRDARLLFPANPSREELEQLKVMLDGIKVIVDGLLKSRNT